MANISLMANVRPRILQDRFIHVRRSLLGKGGFSAVVNQEVKPQDILGKSVFSAGFSSVNIAKKLGVVPFDAAKYLQRPIGKTIFKGELLAIKNGLLGNKVVTAPTDGVLEYYDQKTGDLRISFTPREIALTSGVFGVIDEIDQVKGEVLIKTMVTEVYGVIGSGKERSGILDIQSNQGIINKNQVKDEMGHHVLVIGSVVSGDVLKKAAGYGVTGIIMGGISAHDFKSVANTLNPSRKIGTDVGISLIVTEGFGAVPIGDDIFNLIKNFEGKFVFINGNTARLLLPSTSADSILALRKIALPTRPMPEIQPEVMVGEIHMGSWVRIIWPPFFGVQGRVLGIDGSVSVLESGISSIMLTVETPRQKIKVAYTNVELI